VRVATSNARQTEETTLASGADLRAAATLCCSPSGLHVCAPPVTLHPAVCGNRTHDSCIACISSVFDLVNGAVMGYAVMGPP
jgi:hypothetical protein